jgi:tetratricopeptide (TPR) repeat protein
MTKQRTSWKDGLERWLPKDVVGLRLVLSLGLIAGLSASSTFNLVWGINLWALWPPVMRAVVLLIGLSGVWLPLMGRAPAGGGAVQPGGNKTWRNWLAPLSLAFLFLAVCIMFPTRTLLFGDADAIATRLAPMPRSPLFSLGLRFLRGAGTAADTQPAIRVLRWVSMLGGVVYVVLLVRGWRSRLGGGGLCTAGALVGSYLCLFQGYIEAYAWFVVAEAAWLVALLEAPFWRRRTLLVVGQVVLVFAHALGWLFVPATLWALLGERQGRGRRAAVGAALLILGVLTLLAIGRRLPESLRHLDPRPALGFIEGKAVVLLHPEYWTSPDGILSWRKLVDVLNGLFLAIGPGALVAGGLAISRDGRQALASAARTPIGAVAGIMLLARFAVSTGLGAFLDWDLYACFFVPCLFVVALSLADERLRPFCRAAAIPIATTALILTAPTVAVLRSSGMATQRLEAYVGGRPAPGATYRAHVEHRLGDQLLRSGASVEAARAFARAFDHDPMSLYARRAGVAWRVAGKIPEAIREFSRAVEVDRTDIMSLEQRGYLLLEVGKPADAARDLEQVLRTDPDRSSALMGAGIAEMILGDELKAREHVEQAAAAYRRSISAGGQNQGFRAFLAQTLMHLHRWSEAIDEWKSLVAARPSELRAWCALGECYLKEAQPLPAKDALGRALRLQPGSARILARR